MIFFYTFENTTTVVQSAWGYQPTPHFNRITTQTVKIIKMSTYGSCVVYINYYKLLLLTSILTFRTVYQIVYRVQVE